MMMMMMMMMDKPHLASVPKTCSSIRSVVSTEQKFVTDRQTDKGAQHNTVLP